jgi:hypothetical protein
MTTLYKLTDDKDRTFGGTQWGPGVTHTAPGVGYLCSAGWIHAYTDPLVGLMLNAIHGKFKRVRLWESEGEIGKTDHGLKVGCTSLTTLVRMKKPRITTINRVAFGLLCTLQVYREPKWAAWAKGWLDGSGRSITAEEAAARDAAYAAEYAAEYAARAGNLDLPSLAWQAMEVR